MDKAKTSPLHQFKNRKDRDFFLGVIISKVKDCDLSQDERSWIINCLLQIKEADGAVTPFPIVRSGRPPEWMKKHRVLLEIYWMKKIFIREKIWSDGTSNSITNLTEKEFRSIETAIKMLIKPSKNRVFDIGYEKTASHRKFETEYEKIKRNILSLNEFTFYGPMISQETVLQKGDVMNIFRVIDFSNKETQNKFKPSFKKEFNSRRLNR